MAQTHSLDLELSSSQYASIADASQTGLDITGDFTIQAWVKLEQLPSSAGADFVIVNKLSNSTTGGYRFNITSADKILAQFVNSSDQASTIQTTSAVVTARDVGTWVHVAFSADVSAGANGITVYVNGRSVGITVSGDLATSVGNNDKTFGIGVGNADTTPTQFFDGKIKDVRVFSDVRTASEIRSDAHTENVSDANLVGEWNFNNVYTDSSGNGNTLTASGSPVFSTDYPWEGAIGIVDSTFLETNLQAYYTMEETSGTRLDSTANNNDLTDNNTVTSGVGIIENGADFEATNSEYLSITDAAQTGLAFLGDFSASFWVNPEDISIEPILLCKWNGAGSRSYYIQLRMGATDTLRLSTSSDGTAQTTADVSISNYSAGTFHHLVLSYDASAGTIEVFEDGISRGTTGSLSTSIFDSGAVIEIGRYTEGASNYYDGILDEVALYSRVLHYGDVLDLYNSGVGITYSGDFTVSVDDSISITEDTTREVLGFVNVNDSVSITENVSIVFVFIASVSDLISIAEDVVLDLSATQSVFDSLSITEDASFDVSRFISTSDSISITESQSTTLIYAISVDDSVSIEDVVSDLLLQLDLSVSDIVAISEDTDVLVVTLASVSDSISIAENVSTERLIINPRPPVGSRSRGTPGKYTGIKYGGYVQ